MIISLRFFISCCKLLTTGSIVAGKACTYWFNEHFLNLAKQLHTDIDSVSKSNNITIPVTNGQDVSLLHDTSDDIETYPKQV
jgi:hypothetical protein